MNHDQLSQQYLDWCVENGLPQMSADELLVEETVPKTPEQRKYLVSFIERWDSVSTN